METYPKKQIKQALLPRKTGKANYIPLKLPILENIICKKLCNATVQGNTTCTVDHTMPHGAEAEGSCGQWAFPPSLTSLSHSPFKVNCADLEIVIRVGHRHGWEGTGSKRCPSQGQSQGWWLLQHRPLYACLTSLRPCPLPQGCILQAPGHWSATQVDVQCFIKLFKLWFCVVHDSLMLPSSPTQHSITRSSEELELSCLLDIADLNAVTLFSEMGITTDLIFLLHWWISSH